MTRQDVENIRLEFREAFERYCNESAVTEKLLTSLPFPPSGEDLTRLLISAVERARRFQPLPTSSGSLCLESFEPDVRESRRCLGKNPAVFAGSITLSV
jgi:hypothetical protein